jgi:hypothetical protein
MNSALDKYLARWLEPEGRALEKVGTTFGHAIVIPAYDEGESLFTTLRTIPSGPLGDVLSVLVINAPADAPECVHLRGEQLVHKLRQEYGSESVEPGRPFLRWFDHPRGALLCVDRMGPRSLPKGQGVGLARKIGCDIALQLHARGKLRSAWIHTTDADVELPATYFHQVPSAFDGDVPAALLYPFWHRCEPPAALADAMHRYEIFLRYYVLGLTHAGSPYAFHTLGSTLAIHALAYARVRGFPRRAAGEDFYLLNKLGKVGAILQLDGEALIIRGRSSHRVPFGTGAALKQILAGAERGEPYRIYAPEVFLHLKTWLSALELLSAGRARKDPCEYLKAAAGLHEGIDARQLQHEMAEFGLLAAVCRAERISRDASTMARHLHTWFDAFRTLKLIHRLTRVFPKRELSDAIRAAPFLGDVPGLPQNLEQLRHSLVGLERQLRAHAGRVVDSCTGFSTFDTART